MSNSIIARRYAQALHRVGDAERAIDSVDADAVVVATALAESRNLRRFFQSPIISRQKKKAVVQQLFGKRLSPLTVRFLELLVDQNREQIIDEILDAYRKSRDEELGYITAEARVAWDMGMEEQEKLTQRLSELTSKNVRLTLKKDPSILGGAIVRIDDTVYDGSVRRQLEALRSRLQNHKFLTN